MTKLEYTEKLDNLKKKQDKERFLLLKEYLDSNNPYKIGDKFKDSVGVIIIERIQHSYGYGGGDPHLIFSGVELKKDGTPRQDKRSRATIYCHK